MNTLPGRKRILEGILNDHDSDITEQELETLLERELEKPEEQMDMRLIDDILACLESHEPGEEDVTIGLAKLRAAYRERKANE